MTILERKQEILEKRKEVLFNFINKYRNLTEEYYDKNMRLRVEVLYDIKETGRHIDNLDMAYDVLDEHESDYKFFERVKYLTY